MQCGVRTLRGVVDTYIIVYLYNSIPNVVNDPVHTDVRSSRVTIIVVNVITILSRRRSPEKISRVLRRARWTNFSFRNDIPTKRVQRRRSDVTETDVSLWTVN